MVNALFIAGALVAGLALGPVAAAEAPASVPSDSDAAMRIGITPLGGAGSDLRARLPGRLPGATFWSCEEAPDSGDECGAAQALDRLGSDRLDLALVQEDRWAEVAVPGVGPPAVQRIFDLYLHVLVRRPLHLESLRDLPRLRVCMEPDPDGRRTIGDLLDRAGVSHLRLAAEGVTTCPPADQESVSGLGEALAGSVKAETFDVALRLAPAGDPGLDRILRGGGARLASLDYRTVQLLEVEPSELRAFRFATLPADVYGLPEDVQTVAVPALLVARVGLEEVDGRPVADALEGIWRGLAAERREPPAPAGDPPTESELPQVEWRRRDHGRSELRGGLYTALLFAILALGLLLLFRSRRPTLRRLRRNRPMLIAFVVVPTVIVVVTLLTYLVEHRYNEHFSSPAASFWSITVYLFSGLEDRSPFTTEGKLISAFGLILGPVLFTLATGWVASRFVHWERKMPKHLDDHYLLLNWNPRALQAVRQIHHPVITAREGVGVIVVLSDDDGLKARLEGAGMGKDPFFEDLYVSFGDPTKERALLNVNAQDARTILALADERRGDAADERTLCSLVMLRKIARDLGQKDLHVVAELVNAENQGVCDELARDFPGMLETVSSGEIRSCLLAQATLNRGLVRFFKDLLTVSEDTNELYTLPVPERAVGRRFAEFAAEILGRDGGVPIVPVGIQREGGDGRRMICNPRPDGPEGVLEEGDRLVVLAYEPPREEDLEPAGAV